MSEIRAERGTRTRGRAWAGLALAAVAVVFILQNRDPVSVRLFTIQISSPQWLTLSVVFVLGGASAWLVARRRRR